MTLTLAPALVVKLYNSTKTLNGEVSTPSTTSVWFPTPPGLVSLPSTPAYTTNPEFVAANSTPAPEWFDPKNVDLEQLFNDLVPTNVDPIYPVELQTSKLVEAQNEIVPVSIVLRSLLSAFYATYSLTPQISPVSLTLKPVVQTLRWLTGSARTGVVTGYAAVLNKAYDPISRARSFTVTGQSASLSIKPLKIKAEPYQARLDYAKTITLIGGEATILDALEETDSIPAGSNISINYDVTQFGSAVIEAGSASILGLVRKPNKPNINIGQDFTVSFWFSPQQDIAQNAVSGVFQLSEEYGLCLYRPPLASETFLAFGQFGLTGYIPSGDKFFTPLIVHGQTLTLDTFVHVAIESHDQQIKLYINGIQSTLSQANPGLRFDETNLFTVFGFGSFVDDVLTVDADVATSPAYLDDLVIDNFGRYAGLNFIKPVQSLPAIEATKLIKKNTLTSAAAVLTLAGQSADLNTIDYNIKGQVGTIGLVGQIANLKKFNVKMPADAGNVTLAGFETNEGPYFVIGSTVSSTFSGGVTPGFLTRTFNPPASYELNDIMIFMAETSGDSTVYPTMTGWNLIGSAPVIDLATTSGSKFYVWWRRITSTREPSWSLPVEDHITASVFLIRNADPDQSPIAAFTTTSTTTPSTSFSAPGLALNVPLTRVFVLAANPSDSSSTTRYSSLVNASLTSLTEHFEYASSSNNGGGLVAVSGKRLKSGVVNATTMTKNFSSTDTIITVAFKSKGVESIETARDILAGAGSYVVIGQSAALNKVVVFSVNAGSFTATGLAADLNTSQGINGEVGSFTHTGQPSTLTASRNLKADPSSTNLSGQDATFKVAVIFDADSGSYSLNGQSAEFIYNQVLPSDVGSIVLNGQDAALTYTPAIGSLEDQFELTALLEDDLLTLDF